MCRADDARVRVREQDRHAIGGEDAEQQPGTIGDDRVDMRSRVVGEGLGRDHRFGRMDLVDRDQRGPRQDGVHRAAAIFGDGVAVVARAETDIQPGQDAGRDAAFTTKEAMGNAVEGAGLERGDRHTLLRHSRERGNPAFSLADCPTGRKLDSRFRGSDGTLNQKPPGSGQCLPVTAITLNNSPISSGWVRRR
jgi:hypothetical protein